MTGKKALIVIDMQSDYLRPGRKPMFSYDAEKLVASVNRAIASYKEKGYDIIYIRQVFQNIITNKWFIGFTLKGTPGAEIYNGIDIVSNLVYDKYFPDTYTSGPFREHMEKEGYSEVVLCGLDECGCVGATAKGARKAGMKTYMLTDAIGCRFPDAKRDKMRSALKSLGISYI
ncbi:MAG: cysteine hydrolase [Clostridiales bacterium]|nr:cysteine hydrolase [Clostridiales bacterium]